MNAESLVASAAINIGLALIVLSQFSVLKKQPSNAPVYYSRRLARKDQISFDEGFTLSRLLPSVSWIPRAFRVSEEEILETSGLDALVVIRLFKLGIKFFLACSVIGLVILLPINYTGQHDPSISDLSYSMDCFTITNISEGSDRLWVHFSYLCFISVFGLYLLYKEYNEILGKRIQLLSNVKNRPDQFTILVREIPFCNEHTSHGCCVGHFFSKHYPYTYQAYQMVHDGKDLEDLVELPAAFVSFKTRCGAALAAQSQQHPNPLLWTTEQAPEPREVLWNNLAIPHGLLLLHKIGVFAAATVLTIFFAIPVTAVQGIAKFEKLKKWFPPAMAVQLIPGLRSIITGYLPRESFTHPKYFPSRLASAVSSQADFFITYILTDGLSGFSLEILQPGLIIWHAMRALFRRRKKQPYLYSLPYYRIIPFVTLSILIGMEYAVVAPLLLPFLIVYFFLGYVVYINQIQDVYEIVYETGGQFWPYIYHYIFISIVLMQITMIGLFGLKLKPAASIATVALLLLTLLFNQYCNIRFLPSFFLFSIQNAVQNDERDEKDGLMEVKCETAIHSYRSPCLRPMNFSQESYSTQPLVSST
ncbi:CSC1-like protein At3g54510 isoform X2 [Telopea speciosissima]|uniref:CSC1-like protein At3g54510 isoform X2 n=1 Tax=Telopea speciosissima TaxID=54955 RepID=UPI001CC5E07C|nr:CSC1-like protein At3g54510 isoform X2 [Telopea speciosissima]